MNGMPVAAGEVLIKRIFFSFTVSGRSNLTLQPDVRFSGVSNSIADEL